MYFLNFEMTFRVGLMSRSMLWWSLQHQEPNAVAQWSLYVKKTTKKNLKRWLNKCFHAVLRGFIFILFFWWCYEARRWSLSFLVVNTISLQGFSHRFLLWHFQKHVINLNMALHLWGVKGTPLCQLKKSIILSSLLITKE